MEHLPPYHTSPSYQRDRHFKGTRPESGGWRSVLEATFSEHWQTKSQQDAFQSRTEAIWDRNLLVAMKGHPQKEQNPKSYCWKKAFQLVVEIPNTWTSVHPETKVLPGLSSLCWRQSRGSETLRLRRDFKGYSLIICKWGKTQTDHSDHPCFKTAFPLKQNKV